MNTHSPLAGMGCIPMKNGFAFRVWAPHASAVCVTGDFNNWKEHPLTAEENGTWYGEMENAREGEAYRYLIRNGNQKLSRPDPQARMMQHSVGNSILWKPKPEFAGPKFESPTLDRLAIYELHIGSFYVREGDTLGTFDSAMDKLPYLRELGINAIEIMPIAEFAGDLSWGYNPAHPYAIETSYGGPEGFLRFVKTAHAHGIAVILDVVYNHFGPGDLGLWQFDGWSENNMGGIYFYNDWRASTPWGDSRPDYGRGEVRSYIRDNALMWFREYGVDGLRYDMTVFIRTFKGCPADESDDLKEGWGLLQWVNDEIRKEFPKAILIAEDLQNSEWLIKDTGAGGAGFSTQWDAAFVHPIRAIMIASDDARRDLNQVVNALTARYDDDAFTRVVYSESHDEVANGKARLPEEIHPDDPDSKWARKRSTLAAALVFTAPGAPMLFQGQEFLEDKWFRDHVPLDWKKRETYHGIHTMYRDLLALRLNKGGVTAGLMGQFITVYHLNQHQKILAFHRYREGGAGDDTLVVLNLSNEATSDYKIGAPHGGLWKVRFNSSARAYSDDFSEHFAADADASEEECDGMSFSLLTGVAPYSMVLYSQDA